MAATEGASRYINTDLHLRLTNVKDDDIPPPRQPNLPELDAILQVPVAQDLILGWLSDLPEAKIRVSESVIWPKLCGGKALVRISGGN